MGKKLIWRPALLLSIFAVSILFFTNSAYAVSVLITDYPQAINQDPFTITVSVSGASPATNYLRVDLYKENTTNYFGETFNGSDWYGASDYTKYFPITIDSTEKWSGEVQARIGNPSQTEYDWQGSYKLRIRRYTSSGGTNATEANNSSQTITINIPQPSPSPSPTPTPSASPSASSTSPKSPSPSPKLTPSPPKSSSPKSSPQVLGASDNASSTASSSQSPLSSPSPAQVSKNSPPSIKIASIFIGSGLILIALAAGSFLWYKKERSAKVTDGEQN